MPAKSLKDKINALANLIGGSEPPNLGTIKGKLLEFGALAETLESGQSTAEMEARIADLGAQLGSLQTELQAAKTEIEVFRAEDKKREEKDPDIPDTQLQILKRLPLVHEHGHFLDFIAESAGIPKDEAEIHFGRTVQSQTRQQDLQLPAD